MTTLPDRAAIRISAAAALWIGVLAAGAAVLPPAGAVLLPAGAGLLAAGAALAADTGSSCVQCHTQQEGELAQPVKDWAVDAHALAGLTCASCHGGDPSPNLAGDPEAAMAPARGFKPAPSRLEIPAFCAKCHSDAAYMKQFNPQLRVDQLTEYRSSVHGIRNAAGDSKTATCIDCHGIHGIRLVASPEAPVYASNVPATCAHCHADTVLMAPYGIPTDQYARYKRSVHAAALLERGDLAAPACNDCHGNHGASPPGVQSVANVCGQCHGREAGLFRKSFKDSLFASTGVPECTVCHENHGILHPTPELFHSGSAPATSAGTITAAAPLTVELGDLQAGARDSVTWRDVLHTNIPAADPRLEHRVEISAEGAPAVVIDATVRPGAAVQPAPVTAGTAPLQATLRVSFPSGLPVEDGDALLYTLTLAAAGPIRAVRVRDLPGEGLDAVAGSICLSCHALGDSCDVATEAMYGAVRSLDLELRDAAALLHRAEVAGMDVSRPAFDLKSKGTTAEVESRALIHSFDAGLMIARTKEGMGVAAQVKQAGRAALAEIQRRRTGLAVSVALVVLVLIALWFKIRQVERARAGAAPSEGLSGR